MRIGPRAWRLENRSARLFRACPLPDSMRQNGRKTVRCPQVRGKNTAPGKYGLYRRQTKAEGRCNNELDAPEFCWEWNCIQRGRPPVSVPGYQGCKAARLIRRNVGPDYS